VGVIPLALLASLFKAEWSILGQLVLSLVMVVAARMGGFWLAERALEKQAIAEIEAQVETVET
jgi:hypothetical protein